MLEEQHIIMYHNPLKRKYAPKPPRRDQERKGSTMPGTPQQLTPAGVGPDKWTKAGQSSSLRKKSGRRNTLSLSHESLVVVEQDQMPQKLSSANSVNSIVHHVAKSIEQEEVGRVASWAVNLDRLLNDPIGISVFTEFLKKEFSEENIVFWKASETYKSITDPNTRKTKAQEIYDKHVCERGSESVNIDSVARKQVESELDSPTPRTFNNAQHQIYQLMKQDSYSRFLKSDLYKTWTMKELDGESLEVSPGQAADKNKDKLDKHTSEKDGKKKGGKGKENEEQHKEKRRRSLLPWRQKSKKPSKSDLEGKNSKGSKDDSDNNNNSNTSTEGASKPSEPPVQIVEVPETISEEPETPKFCRVIMPDGSTTVVGTKQGQTISYVLGKLCEKRNLSIASVDVFLLGSEKPLDLNDDISTLGSKEVTIEKRVLFRMDLPNKKSIGVKAKPSRLIRDVFKPILNKYGYRIEAVDVHLSGQSELLSLDSPVLSIDTQRVIILSQSLDTPNLPPSAGKLKKGDVRPSLDSFDQERGVPVVVEAKDHGKTPKVKQKVTFALQKNTVRNRPNEDGVLDDKTALCEQLKRAQDLSLEDQRGPIPHHLELPDFLRESKHSNLVHIVARKSGEKDGQPEGPSNTPPLPDADYTAQMESYLENINENVAVYTRDSRSSLRNPLFGADARTLNHLTTFSPPTPAKLKSSDKSFSEDGVVPSNEEAAALFQTSSPGENVDFEDSLLMEKSLTDIGFSYKTNKYLSKSRNFVNQAPKKSVQKGLFHEASSYVDEPLSPIQRSSVGPHLDVLDSTLVQSPRSSPYYSDSSLEKEALGKVMPKSSSLNNLQRSSRHTQLHSPIHGSTSDHFLSTVDTDGKYSKPSGTPITVVGNDIVPKIVHSQSKTVRNTTDEITFV